MRRFQCRPNELNLSSWYYWPNNDITRVEGSVVHDWPNPILHSYGLIYSHSFLLHILSYWFISSIVLFLCNLRKAKMSVECKITAWANFMQHHLLGCCIFLGGLSWFLVLSAGGGNWGQRHFHIHPSIRLNKKSFCLTHSQIIVTFYTHQTALEIRKVTLP